LTAASTAGRSPAFRAISAAELLFGAFFVIGHNVFRAVPNEVLILAALGVASAQRRTRSPWLPAPRIVATHRADRTGGGGAADPARRPRNRSGHRAVLAGVVIVSVLFGYGHYYKGPAGVVDSAIAGLILGIAYLLAGRNLWACILAHGFIDTFAVVVTYLGIAD
jgi:membrane protease YdiL (CAAX protease family)